MLGTNPARQTPMGVALTIGLKSFVPERILFGCGSSPFASSQIRIDSSYLRHRRSAFTFSNGIQSTANGKKGGPIDDDRESKTMTLE